MLSYEVWNWQMTLLPPDDWRAVQTLIRWRMRMIRNSMVADSGFLSVFVGGLLYLAIVVVVSIQAKAGGILARELAGNGKQLALSLLGMHLFVLVCIQAGALYFFRMSLQGDFRTARWRALPVSRNVLRRAYLIDCMLNPGAIAVLVATWILVFAYARPLTASSVIACLLVSPIFVFLSQSLFIVASDLLNRFRVAGSWLLFLHLAAVGVLLSGLVVTLASGASPALIRDILLNNFTHDVLRVPPWGLPLFIVERADSGQNVKLFASLIAAMAGASLLLVAANRISATAEPD